MNRVITNYDELAVNQVRRDALQIAEKGYQSIAIGPVFKRELTVNDEVLTVHGHHFDLSTYNHIYVIGAGKGAAHAAAAVEHNLGDYITDGAVIDVTISPELKRITSLQGTHPLPSVQNQTATDHILELLAQAGKNDLVITILCGGGSALFTRPAKGISVDEVAELRLHMLKSGASIQEINTVYKHTSGVHGGHLAMAAFPATVLTLAVSDVPQDDPFVIASGPTLPDKTTLDDARTTAAKYGLHNLPLVETPNEDDFSGNHSYVVLASAEIAVKAMAVEAEKLGYEAQIAGNNLSDTAEKVAETLAPGVTPGQAILFAGEPPVVVKSTGRLGGRMQHLAVSSLPYLPTDAALAACASDGSDFINGIAGAVVDGSHTIEKCRALNLNIEQARLDTNSHKLLKTTGDLLYITPGITANVADFGVFIRVRSPPSNLHAEMK